MTDMTRVVGTLESSDVSDFSAHLVVAEFEERFGSDGSQKTASGREAAHAAKDGSFSLGLPPQVGVVGPVTLTVHGPHGLPVGGRTIGAGRPTEDITIAVVAPPASSVEPSDDVTLGSRTQYRGRVLDSTGAGYPVGHQVLLWSMATVDSPPSPLSVALTRAGGYFSGPWVDGEFTAIVATVGTREAIAVPLDGTRMPTTILLITDPPEIVGDEGDGPCSSAESDTPRVPETIDLAESAQTFAEDPRTCTTFTIPDRTVDEVTYHAVVRTTQPTLKAQTPIEERPIPSRLIERLTRIVLDRPQRIVTTTPGPSGPDRPGLPPPGPPPIDTNPTPTPGQGPVLVPGPSPFDLAPGRPRAFVQRIPDQPPGLDGATVVGAGLRAAQRYAPGIVLGDDWLTSAPVTTPEVVLARRIENDIPLQLETSVLEELVRNPGAVSPRDLIRAEHRSVMRRFRRTVRLLVRSFSGRFTLEADAQIAWDQIPDAYQATGVAHGHLLTLKQIWRADGYSQGDVLYSLPLAPGQQKLVSILDWNRSEVASRRADRTVTEELVADLSHDSDIAETISSVLTEELSGSSTARNWSFSKVVGGFVGPIVFGASGGVSGADSTAQQTSSREVSGEALQTFRDRTAQSAAAVRSQRSSVVQVGRQGESVRAQTEVIANYNHCHAMTVHYFEVLRHLQVSLELAAAQECLFVPLAMSEFTATKTLRWRSELTRALRRPSLRPAFEALERVETDWADSEVPVGRHADEPVVDIDGELWLIFELPRPADDENGNYDAAAWAVYGDHFADSQAIWERYLGVALEEDRAAIWDTRLAPTVIQSMVDDLSLAVEKEVWWQALYPDIDATMVGVYRPGEPLLVTFRADTPLPEFLRSEVTALRFNLSSANLPPDGSIIVHSGTVRYRTDYLSTTFFENRRIHNDISLGDSVYIPTPLSKLEKRNPRDLDRRRADELLEHLSEHVEYYHRATWMTMDPNRRFLLLDGVIAPNANGRSVASVVENRVLGVVGNSLVMPVAPGVKLDPTYEFAEHTPEDLRHLYAADPAPPMRVSFPTSGVFAEAVLGSCNSCERIDDTRFWRFEDAPIPESPTAIDPISMATRRTTPPSLTPDALPEPVVGYQQVPETLAATGLAAAMDALGTGDIFKDLTGLTINQANSAAALEATMSAAKGFATRAGALAQQQFLTRELDRTLELIEGMDNVSQEDKQSFTEALFRGALGQVRPDVASPAESDLVKTGVDKVTRAGSGSVTHTTPFGTASLAIGSAAAPIDADIDPVILPIQQPTVNLCWAAGATMMENWRLRRDDPIEAVVDRLGPTWRSRFDTDLLVTVQQFRDMAAVLGWTEDPPQSHTPHSLASLVEAVGAVLAIGDDVIANNSISHVRILVAVDGDGTSNGTLVTVANSATGLLQTMSFAAFEALHHADDPVSTNLGFFHY
jgi:Papain-like cysteine protease AvrRpt2